MRHDGRAIANFVLDSCESRGQPVTNLSLQKIIYFCHVWSLIELKEPLVKQAFEAWPHGPVLQYIYRLFKTFEDQPIVGRAKKLNPMTGKEEVVPYVFNAQTAELLNRVVDFYSRMSAIQLRSLSHVERGPWHETWNHGGAVNPGMKIDNDSIREFYSRVREHSFSIQ